MAQSILPARRTADGLEYEYREYAWGDLIRGSKEVLQRMGIGVGISFPGEPGGNRRQTSTFDPRGFRCVISISRAWEAFPFSVRIEHPGREYFYPAEDWIEAFPGVLRQEFGYYDHYKGSAEALTAAGIVPPGMFPGMPGMRSTRVTILADGSLPSGHRNAGHALHHGNVGVKRIEKRGKNTYEVSVAVPCEIGKSRCDASDAHSQEWQLRMAESPRAPRIDQLILSELDQIAKSNRTKLHLAWSRPKFVPGFNVLPPGPFAR